ncbi:MAG TPA: POTRA domain-containing protein, partial [Candidatus Omnitrophota bacterium]|nr:POTRA domain-containing protein [Candidatus Omnitrophota bacterium]
MVNKRSAIFFYSILILLFLIISQSFYPARQAHAQPPATQVERATYQTDQFGNQAEAKAKAMLKGRPAPITEVEEPEVEDTDKFMVKKINLEGCEAFTPDSFAEIVSKYENKEIGLNAIQRVCKKIEREYLKRGVIAAVFPPPQDIKEGVLTLKVIEAKMGELEIGKAMWFNSDRLKYYWPIKSGEVLRYDKISK